MKNKHLLSIFAVVVCAIIMLTPLGQTIVAQSTLSIEGFIAAVFDSTNNAMQISIVSTDSNQTIGGNLSVTGTSTLTGAVTTGAAATVGTDLTVTDDFTVGGWPAFPSTTVSAQSYTISSTGKAHVYISEYSDTAASTIFLPDTPADGTMLTIVDGDLNAGTNNVVIATEGSDTINESATFTQNANGESTQVLYDSGGTDWQIIGGYAE